MVIIISAKSSFVPKIKKRNVKRFIFSVLANLEHRLWPYPDRTVCKYSASNALQVSGSELNHISRSLLASTFKIQSLPDE